MWNNHISTTIRFTEEHRNNQKIVIRKKWVGAASMGRQNVTKRLTVSRSQITQEEAEKAYEFHLILFHNYKPCGNWKATQWARPIQNEMPTVKKDVSDKPWAGDGNAGRAEGAACKPLNSWNEELRKDNDAMDDVTAAAAMASWLFRRITVTSSEKEECYGLSYESLSLSLSLSLTPTMMTMMINSRNANREQKGPSVQTTSHSPEPYPNEGFIHALSLCACFRSPLLLTPDLPPSCAHLFPQLFPSGSIDAPMFPCMGLLRVLELDLRRVQDHKPIHTLLFNKHTN